ncbi:hypothetical protein ACQP2K_24310 [Microbispora siamensis]
MNTAEDGHAGTAATDWHVTKSPQTRIDPQDRYRVAARTGNTPDSFSGHTGFRRRAATL